MIKSKLVKSLYGKKRVIENYKGINRLYVSRTNIKTYVVHYHERLSLDSMVEINNEYHFSTLKDLHKSLNK